MKLHLAKCQDELKLTRETAPPLVVATYTMPAQSSASSAERPGKQTKLPLAEMNKTSAKTGSSWRVVAWKPKEDCYEYMWQGKQRRGTNFIVTLVSEENTSNYCQAQFKKTTKNGTKYEQMKKLVLDGKRFVITKVGFVEDAKVKYVSSPLKNVVDLSSTKIDLCVDADCSDVQPSPQASVAGSSTLEGNQFFDVTALVNEVQETRDHSNDRSSFVIMIYDGSMDRDSNKVKIMPLRIYFDTWEGVDTGGSAPRPALGEDIRTLAEEHMTKKTALTFFCISGTQDDDGKFAFRNTKHTLIVPAVGSKAEKLKAATELHNLSTTDTVAFEQQTATTARDWSTALGSETKCGLLASFARTGTGVPALDEGETIWQMNWVRVTEPPPGQTIRNQYGNLWLPVTCRDDTGVITLYITEKAAVKLTNAVDAAEFEQLYAESRLCLQFFSSVKVLRRPSRQSSNTPDDNMRNDNDFDCYIVDAERQNMQEIPSNSLIKLLPMLDQAGSTDSALPATLAMIRKSEHHALAVQYISQEIPEELISVAVKTKAGLSLTRACSRAVVLVVSNQRSKAVQVGDDGHKLVTENVVDLLYPDSAEPPATRPQYKITSFCTLDNITDLKLDPPKSGSSNEQAALISVTDVLDETTDNLEQPVTSVLADDVQLLTPEEAASLKPMFYKSFCFAALAGQISRKRRREPWSPSENPGAVARCRTLGRSPTAPPLPDYAPSPQANRKEAGNSEVST